MNELQPDPRTLLEWLVGALVTVIAWLGRGAHARLRRLEENAVMREEMLRLHEENKDRLDEIRETTTATHNRIDQLYRDITR